MIPLSVPNLKGNELKYVTEAINAEWVSTGGKFIDQFEQELASYLNIQYGVACQSGTAGLHLALSLIGVHYGDEVIVPTLTFIATVNPVRYQGAEPIFMDCDDSLNMDPIKLEKFLEEECEIIEDHVFNKKSNKQIKAIIVVHVFGNIAEMDKIMTIADKYNLRVIEDATEALGTYYTVGKYEGLKAGTIGDIGVFSFNGNKIITTGGGGMLVTRYRELAEKAKFLSTQAKSDPLYYIHEEIGYNYRMTNVQAAIGIAQLEQLEYFIEKKIDNFKLYANLLSNISGLTLLAFNTKVRANHWFYTLKIEEEVYGNSRDELMRYLDKLGIQSRPVWGLIHQQKPYLKNQSYQVNKANHYRETLLNIPCSSNLSEEDVRVVAENIISFSRRD